MNLDAARLMVTRSYPSSALRANALDLTTQAIRGVTFRERELADAQQACEDAGLLELRAQLWALRLLLHHFPNDHARILNGKTLRDLKRMVLRTRKQEATR